MSAAEPVRLELHGRLARVVLDDAPRGNPVDPPMVAALSRCVAQAAAADVAVLLLESRGRMFSVGGELSGFAGADDPGAHVGALAEGLHEVVGRLVRLPAVVVTAVQGTAAGAGVSLAAAGDLVLAARSARFTLAYTKVGLSPDGGATLLPASLGLHRTLRLALLNPVLTAEEAHAAGLVSEVHDDDALGAAVEAVLATLLAGSREAQVATKRLLRGQAVPAVEAALERETTSISRLAATPDGREGVAAFLARRPAAFPSSR